MGFSVVFLGFGALGSLSFRPLRPEFQAFRISWF